MAKWVVAGVLSVSTVAWLAVPPGMMPTPADRESTPDASATQSRLAALARASIFRPAGSGTTPSLPEVLSCRYVDKPVSGTTPKFDCTLDNGDRIRVKYGSVEWKGEVAATRLLSATGFGADTVSMAQRLRCYGCPSWPYQTRQISERLHVEPFFEGRIDYDDYTDFTSVSVERRGQHKELEFGDQEGWGFHELSAIDPSVGGAPRDEVDALRLMAVFLNHWDNKPSNQSLLCVDDDCEHPLAMIQDAGSTFGPKKVDLDRWRDTPVWAEATGCRVTMKHLPYDGGTFVDVEISEGGRRLLAAKLQKITRNQIRELLSDAQLEPIDAWVAAFDRRLDAIARRAPCPS